MGAALLGAPLLSATAGASTVGLFGAGGVFSASVAASTIGGAVLKFAGSELLSGLLTGAGAFGQIQAGNMQADILNMQARQSELSARQESLKGRQQSLAIKKQLERDLSSQNATFAARGVLAGEGSAAAAAEESRQNASDDIDIATFGAEMGSESEKIQAAQDRISAAAAKKAGRNEAINSIAGSKAIRNTANSLLGNL
jgi:hypothetical protein